jgi:hypothetical protein
MELFRKYHFVSVAFILFAFLIFSRYSNPVLTKVEQERSNGDIEFSLINTYTSDYLLPGFERFQNIHVLPLLKCYSESQTYSEIPKTLLASERIHPIPLVSDIANSKPLEQICKFQI